MSPIYLDNNATTRPADEVVTAMADALREQWANPSSVHRAGQAARQQIELAREQVCRLIGCEARELIFTSGGTEATNLAIRGALDAHPDRKVLITDRLEHSATRETAEQIEARGAEIIWIEAYDTGALDLDMLRDTLSARGREVGIVSVQWANNETGVIQPVEVIGEICRQHGVLFHCDGTQWVGKMPTNLSLMPIDLMTFSAHKFHGPKGIGGLFVRRGARIHPQISGGPQERERRGGTENTSGIIGFGIAAELALRWLETDGRERQGALRDGFESSILGRVPDATVNGANSPRIWNTTNIAFERLESEAILILLSERGIYASAGAACSSGSLDPSPVLLAMGIPPERAHGSIRFSISRETTDDEIEAAITIVPEVVARLRRSMTPA